MLRRGTEGLAVAIWDGGGRAKKRSLSSRPGADGNKCMVSTIVGGLPEGGRGLPDGVDYVGRILATVEFVRSPPWTRDGKAFADRISDHGEIWRRMERLFDRPRKNTTWMTCGMITTTSDHTDTHYHILICPVPETATFFPDCGHGIKNRSVLSQQRPHTLPCDHLPSHKKSHDHLPLPTRKSPRHSRSRPSARTTTPFSGR